MRCDDIYRVTMEKRLSFHIIIYCFVVSQITLFTAQYFAVIYMKSTQLNTEESEHDTERGNRRRPRQNEELVANFCCMDVV